jgi:hypothetical protein
MIIFLFEIIIEKLVVLSCSFLNVDFTFNPLSGSTLHLMSKIFWR